MQKFVLPALMVVLGVAVMVAAAVWTDGAAKVLITILGMSSIIGAGLYFRQSGERGSRDG